MRILRLALAALACATAVTTVQAQQTGIRVLRANYGMGQDFDVTADIANVCDGTLTCEFKVDLSILPTYIAATVAKGISIPGVKSLRITYRCPTAAKATDGLDGAMIKMGC